MPWGYALHFQTVPWVHLILSSLQGRSTALSVWFKIAVNLTKWQFINPAKLGRLYFQPEGTLFQSIKFHYNERKIICTPPPSACHLSLSPAKSIFSSWLFFNSSTDKSGISLPNRAWKWIQMSRLQSSPFQELVLLNILIHRMIINQTETSCFTPAVAEKPKQWLCVSPCWQSTKVEEFWKSMSQSQARFIKTVGKVCNTATKSTQSGFGWNHCGWS